MAVFLSWAEVDVDIIHAFFFLIKRLFLDWFGVTLLVSGTNHLRDDVQAFTVKNHSLSPLTIMLGNSD